MFAHLSAVDRICLFAAVVIATVYGIHCFESWRDRRVLLRMGPGHKAVWQACRFEGGGSVYTPQPMTESEVVIWASALGRVMYVDTEHHKIFFRPK